MPTPIAPLPEPVPSAARERVVEVLIIDVRALMGYVQIRFPAGVRVQSASHALFGFFSVKGTGRSAPGAASDPPSVVRITGRAALGFAEANIES